MSQMFEDFLSRVELQPLALGELEEGPVEGRPLVRTGHPLREVKVSVEVRLGCAAMTVGELLDAREQAVLTLDRRVGDPVDLLVEGRVVARGELVAVGDCFGVRLTELPLGPS